MAGYPLPPEILANLAAIEELLGILERRPKDAEALEEICQAWVALSAAGGGDANHTLEALGRETARVFDLLRCTRQPTDPEVLQLARATYDRILLLL